MPEPPVLSDFLDPTEGARRTENKPDVKVLEPIHDTGLMAPSAENDKTVSSRPGSDHVDGLLTKSELQEVSQVPEPKPGMIKKDHGVITKAGSAALGGLGTVMAAGGTLLTASVDAVAGGGLAVLTAVGIKSASNDDGNAVLTGAVNTAPAKTHSAPTAGPKQRANQALSPKPAERDAMQRVQAGENLPALTFGGDIAELPKIHSNEPIIVPTAATGHTAPPSTGTDNRLIAVASAEPAANLPVYPLAPDIIAPDSVQSASPNNVKAKIDIADTALTMNPDRVFAAPDSTSFAALERHRLTPAREMEDEGRALSPSPVEGGSIGREQSPGIDSGRGKADVASGNVAQPMVNPIQEGKPVVEASARSDIIPWPDAPTLSRTALINQCKITLAANEVGVLKQYIDSDYYGHVPVFEVMDQDADFSQPVYRHYIEIDGEKVAVLLSSAKAHGIKYAMIDESRPDNHYGLLFDNGHWQLQAPTAEQVDPRLLEAITFDMIDPHCTEDRLSAPDDRGLQWASEHRPYLRIRGFYARVYPIPGFSNLYAIKSRSHRYGVSIRFKKGRFILETQANEPFQNGLPRKIVKQRIRIKRKLAKVKRALQLNNKRALQQNRMLRCALSLCEAFKLHKNFEAGSIHHFTRLGMAFIEKFVIRNKISDPSMVEIYTLQLAWVENITFPLQRNTKIKKT
ncbi:hypothetical protein FCN80_25550 [Martelella alba]|uniref:Uncharacterized protein n=1 Tax=Martelella alba TaxID=2590451 RepID=A0ABY2SD84_9HYPH|nr:hypothetical protein FCN80_25550 [Martelella alba]